MNAALWLILTAILLIPVVTFGETRLPGLEARHDARRRP